MDARVFSDPPFASSPPRRVLPVGSCDAHAHIFGPADNFPLAADASYSPPFAPYETYRSMLETAGMARGVVVQPAAYLSDHRALLDACMRAKSAMRGIGLANSAISDSELAALHAGGIIGLRFVEVGDPKGGGRFKGSIGFDELIRLAPRMKELGMQAHLWADCAHLVAQAPMLTKLGIPLVVDHMGRPVTAEGVAAQAFQDLLLLVADGAFWVKLALCRVSTQFPDYSDARPFHDAFLAANPDRLVWGSDWPHIRLGNKAPDVGHLLDLFDEWIARDEGLRRKILVENPETLFGF